MSLVLPLIKELLYEIFEGDVFVGENIEILE